MLALFMDTGMRVGELPSLTWDDIGPGTITIPSGKTGAREVPLSPSVRQLLIGMGSARHPWTTNDGHSITYQGILSAVRRTLQRAGFPGAPHVFRHSFARAYLVAGGDIRSLQRILGHASIQTTSIYLDLAWGDILDQHRRFSPVPDLLQASRGMF